MSHWSLASIPMCGANCIKKVINWYHRSASSSEDTRVLCWILNQVCFMAHPIRAETGAPSGIEDCPVTVLLLFLLKRGVFPSLAPWPAVKSAAPSILPFSRRSPRPVLKSLSRKGIPIFAARRFEEYGEGIR